MSKRFFPPAVILLGLVLAASGPGFLTGAEAAPSLFAPQAAGEGEKPQAPEPPVVELPAPAPPAETAPEAAAEKPLEEAPRLLQTTFAPTVIKSGSAEVVVDAMGNKTLVIRGDDDKPQVMTDDGGGRTQILLGDDTAGLVMDDQGRKTLVVRGDPGPPAPALAEASAEDETRPSVPAASSSGEKPYWIVERQAPEKPYFVVEKTERDGPYWRVERKADETPYWLVAQAENTRPYWAPEPRVVEIVASEVQLTPPDPVPVPAPVAAFTPPAQAPNTISYYMYQDERGVKHLTNTPDDPRYRLFTTVVKVQRGLSGTKTRFSHESLRPIIMKAAVTYNLDPALIAAIIKSESAFDSQAVSWAGAQGLMQLMPGTARDMGVVNSFDPEDNIMGGSRYIRRMLNRFGGDLTLAIAAYNCGPERVAKVWRVPNIAETQNYVKIVLRNYDRYKLQF